jgi:hypothetical protein
MKIRTRDEHLFGPGPKRILSLDGGGVRGVLTLEYLARIETLLRVRHGGDPAFRLSHYFDLIGGTSTGSIIATGLALGLEVSQLQALYFELAAKVFKRSRLRQGLFVAKFPTEELKKALRKQFLARTLGSDDLQTGLMVMTKRLDTGSPWPVHNNPKGRYYGPRPNSTAAPNKDYPLWQMVRASAAAPHFFDPERIRVAAGADGAFVDGGVSPSNNPALQLLLLASLEGFKLQWPLSADQLLLVSVGTGTGITRLTANEVMGMAAAKVAGRALLALMDDCDDLVQTMLQWMSRSPTAREIDREIGDLGGDLLGGRELLSYLRYNVMLDRRWLNDELGLDVSEAGVESLQAMDRAENVGQLASLGATAAEKQVDPAHFPAAFDVN